MKKILLLLLILLTSNGFAYDQTYNATGIDGKGNSIEGTVFANNGENEVGGELTDDNGKLQTFLGHWNGYGHVSGETLAGDSVELDTN